MSKLKACADEKKKCDKKLKFVQGRVENIVGKGGNAGYQHFFFPFATMFSKGLFARVIGSWDCVVKS